MTKIEKTYEDMQRVPHLKPCFNALSHAIHMQACRDYIHLHVRGIVDGYDVNWPEGKRAIKLCSQYFTKAEAEVLVEFIRSRGGSENLKERAQALIDEYGVHRMERADLDFAEKYKGEENERD